MVRSHHMDDPEINGKKGVGRDPVGHRRIDPNYPEGTVTDRGVVGRAAKTVGKAIVKGLTDRKCGPNK